MGRVSKLAYGSALLGIGIVLGVWMAAPEERIRAVPGQWLWMHDRWKSRPKPGEPCLELAV